MATIRDDDGPCRCSPWSTCRRRYHPKPTAECVDCPECAFDPDRAADEREDREEARRAGERWAQDD